MRPPIAAIVLTCSIAACGDAPTGVRDLCEARDLPLSGAANAPVVTDVALEVQPGEIVLLATATDPQGSANIIGVVQQIAVFRDEHCEDPPILAQDDLAGSGVEESFGTVVEGAGNLELFTMIANADSWPVEVDFQDIDGNRTTGRVRARVID